MADEKINKALRELYKKAGLIPPSKIEFTEASDYAIELPYQEIFIKPADFKEYKILEDFSDEELLEAQVKSEQDGSEESMYLKAPKTKEVIFAVRRWHTPYEYPNFYYHLTWCKELQRREPDEFRRIFYVTTRHDGYFETTINTPGSARNGKVEMVKGTVCRKCFQKLKLHNQYNQSDFDINKFYLERSFKSLFTPKIFEEAIVPQDQYNLYWSNLSKFIKKVRGYKCERCGAQYDEATYKDHLEVHHRDRNKNNIKPQNLEVLCTKCHDKEHPNRPKR